MEKRLLKIAVPSGIGDALWSLVKVQDIMRSGNYDGCSVSLQYTDCNRGSEFIQHFDFVESANYEDFPIQYTDSYIEYLNGNSFEDVPITYEHTFSTELAHKGLAALGISNVQISNNNIASRIAEKTGEYIYIESQENFLGKYDWLLIANGHLERGNRIETWLPQFKTNLDIGLNNFVFQEKEIIEAERIHKEFIGNSPFVVFYLGPKAGNTTSGHNRNSLWSLEDWYTTAMLMKEHNPDLKFVITGARYDMEYVLDFLNKYLDPIFINLVGLTEIGVTFALLKRSKFFLSYPCGLGIFSVYLGVPTACFWRPYGNSLNADMFVSVREEMSVAWTPTWANNNYLPLFYTRCSPASIVDTVVNRRFI